VGVCQFKDVNRMDAKNMAVVLCPNLYDTSEMPPIQALGFNQSLLKFTEAAIQWRIEFRRFRPCRRAEELPLPKVADASIMRSRTALDAMSDDDDDDDDDEEDEDDDDDEEDEEDEDNEENEEQEQKKQNDNATLSTKTDKSIDKEKEKRSSQRDLREKKELTDTPLIAKKTNVKKMENESGFVSNFIKGRSGSRADTELLSRAPSKSTKSNKSQIPIIGRKGTGVMDLGVTLSSPKHKRVVVEEKKSEEKKGGEGRSSSRRIIPVETTTADDEEDDNYPIHVQVLDEDNADSDEEANYNNKPTPPQRRRRESRPKKKKIRELIPEEEEVDEKMD